MSCWSNIEGIWSYKDMIGSKFKVKSVCISLNGVINKSSFKYSNQELTLKEVYFRSSTDGKIIVLFRMEEVCGKLFLPKDLELIEVYKATINDEGLKCGKALVGKKNIINDTKEDITTTTTTTTSIPEIPPVEEDKEDIPNNIFDDTVDINSWEIVIL